MFSCEGVLEILTYLKVNEMQFTFFKHLGAFRTLLPDSFSFRLIKVFFKIAGGLAKEGVRIRLT